MIVATAGHVDHGKTLLVHALTGIDTDRLEEEKFRGLTIDLGFAYVDTPSGNRLGFIDVPGHIKFINNMLAGVGAVDFALLVIAADDGPMPQTLEHLAILNLLGIRRGIVALTKIDRVDATRIAEVTEQIRALLIDTHLANAKIYPVSGTTGAGVDELRTDIEDAAGQLAAKRETGHFRLAIDRRFTVTGAGMVVTGSVFAGSVALGDELVLQPANTAVRVRGLHTQNEPAQTASAGDRCAVNIAGANLTRSLIHRGNWLSSNGSQSATDRFDVLLAVLKTEDKPLRHWSPVHIHTAANHVTGRIATLEGRSVAPGEQALVQVVTSEPLMLCIGDRIIVRDQGAERTLGGGPVVASESPKRGRAKADRISLLRAIANKAPMAIVKKLLEVIEDGIDIVIWRNALNLRDAEMNAIIGDLAAVAVEQSCLITQDHLNGLRARLTHDIKRWLENNKDATGITMRAIAGIAGIRNPHLLQHLVESLISDRSLELNNNLICVPGHRGRLNDEEMHTWTMVEPVLQRDLMKPPVLHDLAKELGIAPKQLERVLVRCTQLGYLTRPVSNRFFLSGCTEQAGANTP